MRSAALFFNLLSFQIQPFSKTGDLIFFAYIEHYPDTRWYIFIFVVYEIYGSVYRQSLHIKHNKLPCGTFFFYQHWRNCCDTPAVHNCIFYSFGVRAILHARAYGCSHTKKECEFLLTFPDKPVTVCQAFLEKIEKKFCSTKGHNNKADKKKILSQRAIEEIKKVKDLLWV